MKRRIREKSSILPKKQRMREALNKDSQQSLPIDNLLTKWKSELIPSKGKNRSNLRGRQDISESEAFVEIYERYYAYWVLWAKRIYSSMGGLDPEDIVQEAFIRLGSLSSEKIQAIQNFDSYLANTIRHLMVDYHRREKVREQGGLDFLAELDIADEANVGEVELAELLAKIIESLEERERQILQLHIYQGKTLKEVAEQLEINPNSVYVFYSRALRRVGKILSGMKVL